MRRIIDQAIERVRRILATRRTALEAITRRLIETEVLDGNVLREIIEATTASPQLVPGTLPERRSTRSSTGELGEPRGAPELAGGEAAPAAAT